MDVAVIGVGHVGLVTAACLADLGHRVVGLDDDAAKIETLLTGGVPFHEPDLPQLVQEVTDSGALRFTTDLGEALADAEVVFVCVGTPPLPGGGPDLRFVERVGVEVASKVDHELVLVEKSTVPANTGRRLTHVIRREQQARGTQVTNVHVASNPEFLREGAAVHDTLNPDRIVYGTSSDFARDALRRVYAPLVERTGAPVVETDVNTAELIKHASNAFLATRISFINAVANVCDRVGADVEVVAQGMGMDARIGPAFLSAGLGYGGSCFPKDVDAFLHLSRQVGYDFRLLEEVGRINVGQREVVLDKLRDELWHLAGKTITVFGGAFKPGTDDLRESPGLHLARALIDEGATVRVYDPVASDGVRRELPDVAVFTDPLEASTGAHAVVVATDWPEVVDLDLGKLVAALDYPILVDGRNCLDPEAARAAGLRYHAIGRGHLEQH
ncbi:UDP-glucose dehydrogenase family protein [Egicoccus halophilus]|uniref:UDP-glucose 6-dehydrogenase n=1 Tax=Egicoccus halophilus TaxID=1670830 RepID=A0A8J3ETX2_9ACTN|nr:UDP-glucose/GDP-mannose dehydrogenase family protein [Egicoccus halophilus]GGI05947.1 UDP-glucose 6-dehydrogenase [Egicoccus halophilus]